MKRYQFRKIISILLVCSIIMPCSLLARGATTNDDLNNAKDKQNEINQQIDDVKEELKRLQSEKTDIESYVKELDQKMAKIDTTIDSLNTQMSEKETQIEEAKVQLEQAKIDSDQQYESMKLRIKYLYEHNVESFLSVLLSSKSMGELLNKAEYINKISQYDRQMLIRYMETEQLIADTQAQLESDYQELTVMKNDVEVQKEALQMVVDSKQTEIDNLKNKSSEALAYEKKLEADKAQQEKEILAMEAEIKRQEEEARKQQQQGQTPSAPTVSYDGGMFLWPTPSTRITSYYGDIEDRGAPHQGLDIGAQIRGVSGDPIYAAYDGVVTIATYSASAGNWIWINHGNGLYTVYMHNSSLLVSVGQKVTKGQKIALMGTTGNSTGVHLHFGVRLNGSYVNPMSYLKK